jgi:hypothetical protein
MRFIVGPIATVTAPVDKHARNMDSSFRSANACLLPGSTGRLLPRTVESKSFWTIIVIQFLVFNVNFFFVWLLVLVKHQAVFKRVPIYCLAGPPTVFFQARVKTSWRKAELTGDLNVGSAKWIIREIGNLSNRIQYSTQRSCQIAGSKP